MLTENSNQDSGEVKYQKAAALLRDQLSSNPRNPEVLMSQTRI
jgi:hypothetical protein